MPQVKFPQMIVVSVQLMLNRPRHSRVIVACAMADLEFTGHSVIGLSGSDI